MPNHVTMTRNGRFVVTAREDRLEIIDVFGTEACRTIKRDVATGAIGCVGDELWIANTTLRRVPLAVGTGRSERTTMLASRATTIVPFANGAVLGGASPLLVEPDSEIALEPGAGWFPLHGRRLLACMGNRSEIRTLGTDARVAAPIRGIVLAAAAVFSGRLLAIASAGELVLCTPAGALVQRFELPGIRTCVIADEAGIAIVHVGKRLRSIDLRHGQIHQSAPFEGILEIAIDRSARRVAIARTGCDPVVASYDDVFRRHAAPVVVELTPSADAEPPAAIIDHVEPLAPRIANENEATFDKVERGHDHLPSIESTTATGESIADEVPRALAVYECAAFEGIAILTTNLEKSIDAAFKRRMSMRLYFPFPDEELRAQLWASHVPPETPCGGAFDFTDLARRYPLSGGYIRNSALRAAFLAAQERRPLNQNHLIRAVELEYREVGNIATTGRLE